MLQMVKNKADNFSNRRNQNYMNSCFKSLFVYEIHCLVTPVQSTFKRDWFLEDLLIFTYGQNGRSLYLEYKTGFNCKNQF